MKTWHVIVAFVLIAVLVILLIIWTGKKPEGYSLRETYNVPQSAKCSNVGGSCVDTRNFQCGGTLLKGLCPGKKHIQCCTMQNQSGGDPSGPTQTMVPQPTKQRPTIASLGRAFQPSIPLFLPKPLPNSVGTLNYYFDRYNDFKKRHPTLSPPDYYLNYGNKYANRFTKVLRPRLSSTGQKWVDKTFVLLQQAIENRLKQNPLAFDALERNSDAFKAFAYGTHSDAYLGAGLSYLPPGDLLMIGTTPDLGDLMTGAGIKQVVETGARLIPRWGKQVWDWL